MPFRQAHHVVGAVVALAEGLAKPLNALTLAELKSVNKTFGKDALAVFDLKRAMARRKMTGAPGTTEVAKQLKQWQTRLKGY
jgi:argininosuccinate lyase